MLNRAYRYEPWLRLWRARLTQTQMSRTEVPPRTGWGHTLLIFSGAGLLLLFVTHRLIPALHQQTGVEPVLLWFLLGGLGVFVPLVWFGAWLLRREYLRGTSRRWTDRLRLRRMSRTDWYWTVGGLVLVGLLSAGLQSGLAAAFGELDLHPSFMQLAPLGPGRYWILAAWLPFWLLNVLGEELLWRGVLLPRQEAAIGRWAWLANALGWGVFHVAFGWQLLVLLAPILLIVPYVAQRTGNTWAGVIIHAGLNGPGFLAVALGYV
jgi:membrane protease YdiL (CAAX protease family)